MEATVGMAVAILKMEMAILKMAIAIAQQFLTYFFLPIPVNAKHERPYRIPKHHRLPQVCEYHRATRIRNQDQTEQQGVRPKLTNHFTFFQLPAEIRNRIYHFCLVKTHRVDCAASKTHRISPWQPALTRVNRALRRETLEFFYASNHFQIPLRAIVPDSDLPGEEHQRLRFLRSLRALVRNGHFRLIPDLSIDLLCPHEPSIMGRNQVGLRVQILHQKPVAASEKGGVPAPADYIVGPNFYERNRLGRDTTDWADEEAVDCAIEMGKPHWLDTLVLAGRLDAFLVMISMPFGRLCEVLHILLGDRGAPDGPEKFIFAVVLLVQPGVWRPL